MRSLSFLVLLALLIYATSGVKLRQDTDDDSTTDLILTTLSITADTGSDSILTFDNDGSPSFILALEADTGSLIAKNEDYTILEADNDTTLTFSSSSLTTNCINFTDDIYYEGTQQWKLVIQENFWETVTGWNVTDTTTCGGVTMLGGYDVLSTGNVSKAITDLLTHTVIRVVVSIHFIDEWEGEIAYLLADIGSDDEYEYLWTQWNDFTDAEDDISVCGSSFGEGGFNNLIDVTFAHTSDTLNLIFGTSADDDADVLSWGISSFEIYIL